MGYPSLRACVEDLERHGHLIRIREEVDPHLEMAAIQMRVYERGGPAVYYERVKGSAFPAVSNLFGTLERSRFIFRDSLARMQTLVELKYDPIVALKRPLRSLGASGAAVSSLPMRTSRRRAPVLHDTTRIGELPRIVSWPRDGGPFITLPQVYTEDPDRAGVMKANVGMYRVQLGGNAYVQDHEVGLHYQIHRGIGVHQARANELGQPLRVSIFVGGPPAHTLAAVMPLPEGLPEVVFAGALGNRRFRYLYDEGFCISADADFVITGIVEPYATKPEGPFGDHLGYYSLVHEFPVMRVHRVHHRRDAIWPFTVVGRPPQEDTSFGALIHEITGSAIPREIPGLHAVHAIDAAGVHPLLLAIGSERYTPFVEERRPQEILTIANHILGKNQLSLAKYLLICAREDDPGLDIHDVPAFFRHVLERLDPTRDLHFHTKTTIDTLDYSGTGLNSGSKVAVAVAGAKRRELWSELPRGAELPRPYGGGRFAMPGVMAIDGPAFTRYEAVDREIGGLEAGLRGLDLSGVPLIVLCDDAAFTAATLNNFLWVTFTRSNPSHDVHGVDSFVEHKHWGCRGPLIIDARIKPHHAPPLEKDPEVERRVDRLGAPAGPLHGVI